MKKKLIFILLFFIMLSSLNLKLNLKADEKTNTNFIGIYTSQVPVSQTTKVYVEPTLKSFVEEKGIKVYEETTGWWLSKKTKYYYYANKYINRIVNYRNIYDDVDSLIYMVNELELKALSFLGDSLVKDYKNLVLAYIRQINKNYDGGSYLGWSNIAGGSANEFIDAINEEKFFGMSFKEYFGQFVTYEDYNVSTYGDIDEQYRKKALYLKDRNDGYEQIDLIHMFGCIDGIYAKTGTSAIGTISHNMQKDIISWNGDLQQAAYYFELKHIILNYKNSLMDNIFNIKEANCPREDIIADIDAMNITKMFIDMDETTISNAISAYYSLIRDNKNKRFELFVKTVLMEEEHPSNNFDLDRLKTEIYSQFNIKEENGEFKNNDYFPPYIFIGFSIMRGKDFPDKYVGSIPDERIRIYVVKAFYEFIVDNLR